MDSTDIPRVYSGAYGLCRDSSDRLLLVHVSGGLDKGMWTMTYEIALSSFQLRPERGGSTDRCAWFGEREARSLPLVSLGEFAVELAWPREGEHKSIMRSYK